MALSEARHFEELDTSSLLRTITELNRLIDNRKYVEYWQTGIDLLCKNCVAQFASLYLMEVPQDLNNNVLRSGQTIPEMISQINLWEHALNNDSPSSNGFLDGTLPTIENHSLHDYQAISFPFVFNSITSGSITFVWDAAELPLDAVEQIHQIVQLFTSNGLRANQLLVTHSSREGSDLLYMIAQELTSTLELTSVLNKATETVRTVLNAQASTLFRVDRDHDELIFMIPKGKAASVLEEERMPIDQGVVGWVATNGEPLIVNDTSVSKLFESSDIDSKTGFITRNILCVPLVIQEETVGVLEVLNKEGESGFTSEDEEWLTRVGSQVAIAFENAHLFSREQERVGELATLNSVSQTINSELDVNVILDRITQSVFDILSASRSELLLVSKDQRYLNLVASAGLKAESDEVGWQLPMGKGFAGWCVENNQPLNLRRADEDRRYQAWPELQPLGAFSAAAVPLAHRGKVIGAIVVFSVTNRPYDNDKIGLLQTFANQAAISLRNAELYQSLRTEQERIIRTQEEVRHQLARDLHDNTAQMLSLIIMNLDLTRQMLINDEVDAIQDELDRLEELARQANREIRTLLFELRPIILESRGLIPALNSYHNQLNQSMDSAIHLDAEPLGFQIKLAGASTIFSIIQEAVNNIRKHADANNVWIKVYIDDGNLIFVVEDDGAGFDFDLTIERYDGLGSFGLLNMHERAAILDGSLTIVSSPKRKEQGTIVTGSIPLSKLIDDENGGSDPILYSIFSGSNT